MSSSEGEKKKEKNHAWLEHKFLPSNGVNVWHMRTVGGGIKLITLRRDNGSLRFDAPRGAFHRD